MGIIIEFFHTLIDGAMAKDVKLYINIIGVILVTGLILFSAGRALARIPFDVVLQDAKNGSVEAMCDTALAYYHGEGTLKSPLKAACWTQKAYNLGSKRAGEIWTELELWKYAGNCHGVIDEVPNPLYKKGSRFTEPITGISFIYLPKGCFIMGCHEKSVKCEKDEYPEHMVCLDGFWMAQHEVTQQQWINVMGSNPSRFSGDHNRPVESVSFQDVSRFIQNVNEKISGRMALPTEAQFEYACRNGGELVNYPWAEETQKDAANCGTCMTERADPWTFGAGSFSPNELGIYDMAGNVGEWCRDYYDKRSYSLHDRDNPLFDKRTSTRVVRGGSFADNMVNVRCAARDKALPMMKSHTIGFRLVFERPESQ